MFTVPARRKIVFVLAILAIVLTLVSRLAVAKYLANDTPGDGVLYAQLAKNLVGHHGFSNDEEEPFQPTLIRLPGYPLFIAGVYEVFGLGNNSAVRDVQAVLDTASCVLIALIAWNWDPDPRRKFKSAVAAFVLAALCPFMVIYVGTILTETATVFLMCAITLTSTYALKSDRMSAAAFWWISTGLLGGICVTFRPDAGLFLGAIGLTLVAVYLAGWVGNKPSSFGHRFTRAVTCGALLSLSFASVLAPWTWRNERLFHVFQPLAPAHAEMPGEFVPLGYSKWLSTWVDDFYYVDPMLWSLNEKPISIDEVPDRAFDSDEQRAHVARLLDKYNHPAPPPPAAETAQNGTEAGDDEQADNKDSGENATPDSVDPKKKADDSTDESAEDNSAEGKSDESDGENSDDSADSSETPPLVAMTPEIDAEFAEIARERIANARFHYYVTLPAKRGMSMWFDTHTQYFPFDGELFPLSDLDYNAHQHIWLPLFLALNWILTILALWGAYGLIRQPGGWRWVLLALLMSIPRIVFFSTIENPEPRYVIELYAFTAVLGGIAISSWFSPSRKRLPRHEILESEDVDGIEASSIALN